MKTGSGHRSADSRKYSAEVADRYVDQPRFPSRYSGQPIRRRLVRRRIFSCEVRPVTRKTEFDVLLFDLGGVLTDFAGFEELGRLSPITRDPAAVRDMWIAAESVRRFERGDISPQDFARRVVEEFHLGLPEEEFIHEFVSWVRGPYPGALQLLRRLQNTHRIACLSNSNELHTPLHRQSLQTHIERFYFSDELGHVKPDREIFDHVIRDLAISPQRIAFFDDTPVNVEAARTAGLSAFLVDGITALGAQLQALGLLDRPFV